LLVKKGGNKGMLLPSFERERERKRERRERERASESYSTAFHT
jgi:hypothetical protein